MGREERDGKKAAYCSDCQYLFVYEEREEFAPDAVFCPGCSGRCPDTYTTVKIAQENHSGIKVIRGVRSTSPF